MAVPPQGFWDDDDLPPPSPPHADLEEELEEVSFQAREYCLILGGMYHNFRRMGFPHEEALSLTNMTFFAVRALAKESPSKP